MSADNVSVFLKIYIFSIQFNYCIQLNLVFLFCKSKCLLGLSKALTKLACFSENFTRPSGELQNVQFSKGYFSPKAKPKCFVSQSKITFGKFPLGSSLRKYQMGSCLWEVHWENTKWEVAFGKLPNTVSGSSCGYKDTERT